MPHSTTAADADRARAMAMVAVPPFWNLFSFAGSISHHRGGLWAARGTSLPLARARQSPHHRHDRPNKNAVEEEMKRLAVALMLSAVCIQTVASPAADWPTRPIRIIAPSTPGG